MTKEDKEILLQVQISRGYQVSAICQLYNQGLLREELYVEDKEKSIREVLKSLKIDENSINLWIAFEKHNGTF